MERTADLDMRQRIGEAHIVSSVRDYIVDMLSKDAPPTRRAPRYPVVFIESLEAMVEDDKLLLGLRAAGWIKLVKIWGALRWDDIQKVNPKELKCFAGRMTTTLRYTKTTGPAKRVQELPVCIYEDAFITTPFWLKTGFDLFKRDANFDRDYMLPKLNVELTGFRRVMANYNDVTSYSALVRRTARRPGSETPLMLSLTLACFAALSKTSAAFSMTTWRFIQPWLPPGRNTQKEPLRLVWHCCVRAEMNGICWEDGNRMARTPTFRCTMESLQGCNYSLQKRSDERTAPSCWTRGT